MKAVMAAQALLAEEGIQIPAEEIEAEVTRVSEVTAIHWKALCVQQHEDALHAALAHRFPHGGCRPPRSLTSGARSLTQSCYESKWWSRCRFDCKMYALHVFCLTGGWLTCPLLMQGEKVVDFIQENAEVVFLPPVQESASNVGQQ